MTVKDYTLLADTVRNMKVGPQTKKTMVLDLVTALGRDNLLFDPFKFVLACGLKPSTVLKPKK